VLGSERLAGFGLADDGCCADDWPDEGAVTGS
jgi:hypothetical protein